MTDSSEAIKIDRCHSADGMRDRLWSSRFRRVVAGLLSRDLFVILIVLGTIAGSDGPKIAADLPIPFIGIWNASASALSCHGSWYSHGGPEKTRVNPLAAD
jgi:hypothetical protein